MDALILLALLSAPTAVDEEAARAYNAAGVAINAALHHLAVTTGGPPTEGAAKAGPQAFPAGADLELETALRSVRASYSAVDDWKLKLVRLEPPEAEIRFEATGTGTDGARRTDRLALQTRWRIGEDAALESARSLGGERTQGPGDGFVDQAEERGISYVGGPDERFEPPSDALRFQIIRHAIGGAATGDVDGDGDDDVLLSGGGEARLFVNDGAGRFADGTQAAGLAGLLHVNAALFADFDDDGDADLYVARFYGPNQLFENRGGAYVDATPASGLQQDDMTAVLAAADFDGDGLLDLYLGRFLDARDTIPQMLHYSRNGAPNRLYMGRGGLKFRDASAGSGADDVGLTLGIAAADYDDDGDIDLYLANDFGRNVLLRNDGAGVFEDVARDSGALAVSAGMSASFGDADGDGRPDLYVSSVRSNQRWFSTDVNIKGYILELVRSERRAKLQELFLDLRKHLGDRWADLGQIALSGNYLLRNTGDGGFADVSDATGARPYGWYWSSGFFDVDNDGDQDILATNGWITGPKEHDL